MIAALALLLAAATPAGHRTLAEHAEALGRMETAAREYEAAYEEDSTPELLWRLAIAHRKLKHYSKARAALRGYLRVSPDGPLRVEVERQLARVEVLIEAQQEDFDAAPPRPAPPARPSSPPRASAPRPRRMVHAKRTTPRPDLLSIDESPATSDLLPLPPESAGDTKHQRARH